MLRADALASLYCFHPLRRLIPSRTVRVPILMYHGISNTHREVRHPYYQTETSPRVFEEHMKYLHQNAYSSVDLGEAVRYMEGPGANGPKPVVITFDDGYGDFYTQAFPILSRYGLTATVFLPTASIGETPRQFNGAECLTWSQVDELQRAGIGFGSHTVTHPQLSRLDPRQVKHEVRSSKKAIEDRLSCPVPSFAYPYAFPETDCPFRESLRVLLEEAGYENGVSTIIGTADRSGDRFFMKRLPMNSHDDLRLFRAKLTGGYDWMHTLQYASKFVTIKHDA